MESTNTTTTTSYYHKMSPSVSEQGSTTMGGSSYADCPSNISITSASEATTPITIGDNMDVDCFIHSNSLPTSDLSYEVTTMAEVRTAIDRLDQAIVTLLGTRMRFIEAAAGIKPSRDAVRDQWRVDDVINKCKKTAEGVNFPVGLVEQVYAVLVEGSIMHEFGRFDKLRNIPSIENASDSLS